MTLGSLLLTLLAAYLAVIAYGAVGARRKFAGAALRVVQACLILVLPVVLVGALLATGDEAVVREWGRLFAAMPVLGLVTLVLADRVAAQVDA
jgi:cytochrome c biogenesis protein CcdA